LTTQSSEAPAWGERLRLAGLWLLALSLVAVALVFSTMTQDQFELPKQLLLRGLSSALLGLLLAALLCGRPARWRRTPLDLPVLAWSLWLLVCTFHSISPAVSWRGEYENFAGSLTQLNYSALFFITVQLAGRKDAARLLGRAMLGAATGAALYAAAQALQRDLVQWSAKSIVGDRFFGPLGNPNFLAGLMAMAIPLKLALAFAEQRGAEPRDREQAWRWALLGLWVLAYVAMGQAALLNPFLARPGASLASGLILLVWLASLALEPLLRLRGRSRAGHLLAQGADLLLYLGVLASTGTRGGFLGLMLGLAALLAGWLWAQRERMALRRLLNTAVLGLAALVVGLGALTAALGPSFRTRMVASLSNPGQAYEASRRQIWEPAVHIWRDHFWAGTGVDTFKTVFPAYSNSRFNAHDGENVSSRMAHCEPLQILATEGLVGLLCWLWLCAALAGGAAGALAAEQDPSGQALWLGLGALCVAYLGQNLVSFGVAAISMPFWVAMGLLAAAAPGARDAAPKMPRLSPALALALAGLLAGTGCWLDSQTLSADLGYAFANQAQGALAGLDQAAFEDARDASEWALYTLNAQPVTGDLKDEAELWRQATAAWQQQATSDPAKAPQLRDGYRRAAASLMMIVAAGRLERSVALCPDEVKYRIYLGLCYEELARRTPTDRRKLWFARALEAYQAGVSMNPLNAYYHGNIGRLFGLACEQGDDSAFPPAVAAYAQAIACAPTTRLFYENSLLLQAHYADLDGAGRAMDRVEAADKPLAASLLLSAASTFFQWRSSKGPAWTAAKRAQAMASVLDWASRARALDPGNADTTLALAVFEGEAGHPGPCLQWLRQALVLRPGFPDALAYAKSHHLKP
jgi:O-antigen ligase